MRNWDYANRETFPDEIIELEKRIEAMDIESGEQITKREAEIDRLQAIVDELPVTADGVPVVPGMSLFYFFDEPGVHESPPVDLDLPDWLRAVPLYSTREAAKAAKGNP